MPAVVLVGVLVLVMPRVADAVDLVMAALRAVGHVAELVTVVVDAVEPAVVDAMDVVVDVPHVVDVRHAVGHAVEPAMGVKELVMAVADVVINVRVDVKKAVVIHVLRLVKVLAQISALVLRNQMKRRTYESL